MAHLECIKRQKLRSTKEFPRGLQMIVKTGVVKAARILIEMNPRASRAAEARAGEGPALKARKEAPILSYYKVKVLPTGGTGLSLLWLFGLV